MDLCCHVGEDVVDDLNVLNYFNIVMEQLSTDAFDVVALQKFKFLLISEGKRPGWGVLGHLLGSGMSNLNFCIMHIISF